MDTIRQIRRYVETRGGRNELAEAEKSALASMISEATAKYAWSLFDRKGKPKGTWVDTANEIDALRAAAAMSKGGTLRGGQENHGPVGGLPGRVLRRNVDDNPGAGHPGRCLEVILRCGVRGSRSGATNDGSEQASLRLGISPQRSGSLRNGT